jgi:tetratricopeptide (TPR) repeat protein
MSGLMILAKVDGRNGHLEQALGYIERAIVKHPKQSSLYLAKISLLRDGLMTEKIASVYEKLISLNPKNFLYKKELALFLVQQQQYAEAEKLLKDFLKTDPKNIESQLGLVKLTLATKGKDEATKLINDFVTASPESMPLKFAHYDFLKQVGEFEQAKSLIEKLISEAQEIDDKLKAMSFYADDLLELGFRPRATKLVDEVINKDAKNREGLMVKAKFAMLDQKFNSAIGIYRNILADFPNDTAALIALGKAYEYSGTIELANETYFLAYQMNRNVDEIREGYVDFLIKYKLNERAEQLVQEWVSASPNNPYFLKRLALLKTNNGKFEEAEKIVNRMIESPRMSAFGYQLQGDIFNISGQLESATDSYLKAFNLEKQNAIFMGNVVDAYLKNQKQAQAIALLESIDINASYYYEAQLILAKLYEKTAPGNTEKIYSELIKMSPQRPDAYVNWSNMLSQKGMKNEAVSIIEKCIGINKENYECQFAMADRYLEQKRYDEVISIYKNLVALHPSDLVMRNNLASLLIDHAKNKDEKEHAFYLAQTFANTEEPILKDTYGWAAFKVGRMNEAIKALEFATRKAPAEGLFHYHLAKVYQANNQDKKAKESSLMARKWHSTTSEYALSDLN